MASFLGTLTRPNLFITGEKKWNSVEKYTKVKTVSRCIAHLEQWSMDLNNDQQQRKELAALRQSNDFWKIKMVSPSHWQ